MAKADVLRRRQDSPSRRTLSVVPLPAAPNGQPRRPRGKPKGTGSQLVYSRVRERILGLELAPGADLDEARLVSEFGVSRTPVREALIRLASEGLVVILSNRGARVAPLDIDEIPEILEANELCQRAINRWAAIRRRPEDITEMRRSNQEFVWAIKAKDFAAMTDANVRFHTAIARSCGNRHLQKQHEALASSILRLGRLSCFSEGRVFSLPEITSQHEEMIEAIRAQDAEAADRLARQHAQLFRNLLMAALQESLAGDFPLGEQETIKGGFNLGRSKSKVKTTEN